MVAKPVATTLERAVEALSAANTPSAVIGGFAVAIWGHPRSTRDIDLLVEIPAVDRDRVIAQLASKGFRPKRATAIVEVEGGKLIQLLYSPPNAFLDIQTDLFLAETAFQHSALSRRVEMPGDSLSDQVSVVTCEDLIIFKLLAGRILDRVDAIALLKANRDHLNLTYIEEWIEKLKLQAAWAEIEREASE